MTEPLRIGIMGSASIARKGWGAIHMAGHHVVAVASRDECKAAAFIKECQSIKAFPVAPLAVGGYDALLALEGVDAVYIPLPTMLHKEWVTKALELGKHVVMEKPVTINMADLEAFQRLASEKKLVLLDGTMLTHGKRVDAIRAKVAEGAIGPVASLQASFTFPAGADFLTNDIRVNPEMDPLGAVGDVGWYCIRYALELFPHWTPVRAANCHTLRSVNGVNVAFCGDVIFDTTTTSSTAAGKPSDIPVKSHDIVSNTVALHFHASFTESHTQTFTVLGATGCIEVDDFCLPVQNRENTSFVINTTTIEGKGLEVVHTLQKELVAVEGERCNSQETMLWVNFATLVANGVTAGGKKPVHFREITWKTQSAVCAAAACAKKEGDLCQRTVDAVLFKGE